MTATTTPPDWRGVATERAEEVTGALSALLRRRTRRLLGELTRPHRRALAGLVALVVVENAAALAGPWLVERGIDHGIPPLLAGRGAGPLAVVVAGLAVATVVQALTQRAFVAMTGRVGQQIVLELRTRVFDHFQRLSVSFHESYTSGRVISRQTSDVDALSELVEEGLDGLVSAVLSLLFVGTAMLLLDVPSALVVLAGFPVLVGLTAWFRRASVTAYRATREAVAVVIVQFVETMTGIRAVQAFRREERNRALFGQVNESYRVATRRSFRLIAVYSPALRLAGNLTAGVVLLYGGQRVMDHRMTVGVLAAFLLYLRRFYDPLQDLAQFYNSFQSASAAVEKLSGVLAEEPSVPEPARPSDRQPRGGTVRFDHVRFGYRDAVVLPDLDLHVPAGQTVALLGATGAGKTTVARLLGRFYDPLSGRVTVDGIDLRELADETLRSAVVTVTQEGFLFAGSVADNVAFGCPGAGREEVAVALAAVGAGGFVAALPDGLDTDVGKRGSRLSAGQRQLVAFARAYLADPRVLVLDEATSALDAPTERAVQRAMRAVLADRTALIIAHRLSTVRIADRVLVLEAGRIVEDGTPAELVGGDGHYARLHRQWQASLA